MLLYVKAFQCFMHVFFLSCQSLIVFLSFSELAKVQYQVSVVGSTFYSLSLSLRDQEGRVVATGDGPAGVLKVSNPNLWWPYLMHENPGYRYFLEVTMPSLSACISSHCIIALRSCHMAHLPYSSGSCLHHYNGIANRAVIKSSFASFLSAEWKGQSVRRGGHATPSDACLSREWPDLPPSKGLFETI